MHSAQCAKRASDTKGSEMIMGGGQEMTVSCRDCTLYSVSVLGNGKEPENGVLYTAPP